MLVVEDEKNIRDLVCLHLEVEGLNCVPADDGAVALDLTTKHRFDAMVLDLMLPGVDGISVCRAVRRGTLNRDVPILMLTARREESDKVLGLESGADDYLTKPFGIRELMARVGAILRRNQHGAEQPVAGASAKRVQSRDVALDAERRVAVVRGEPVELTKQEFDLLYLLAARPGIVFSRAALLSKVWNGDTYVTERTVDTVVSRLRRKIERDPQDPSLILTAWGVGYKFADVP